MEQRRAERPPVRRWRWVVGFVILAVGIWALYTFWYSPGIDQQARRETAPAAETSH